MNTEILQRSILFRGLTPEEISVALAFFHAEEKSYKKAAVILHATLICLHLLCTEILVGLMPSDRIIKIGERRHAEGILYVSSQ